MNFYLGDEAGSGLRVIFVRHGKTVDNDKRVFSGDSTCLSDEGAEALLDVKERLATFKFDKVYASPAVRAIRSAEILGLENIIQDDRIREFNFGVFTGMTFAEAEKKFPDEVAGWLSNSKNWAPPEGESSSDHFNRVSSFMDDLKAKAEDCVVVTHYGTIIMALGWAFGQFELSYRFKPENGGISILNFVDDSVVLEKFNF